MNCRKDQTIPLESGNLKAIFVDNSAFGAQHLAGYNGIASLRHIAEDSSLFAPRYAGINLEHIFGGDSLEELFEPRKHRMTLFRKSDTSVILYQEPTPISGVESLIEFTLVPANYIDVNFKCILHKASFFAHGYAGLFWASYIDRPLDKKIYFMGQKKSEKEATWIEAYSSLHGVSSTHRSIHDNLDLFFVENFNASLAKNYSDYHFVQPYYFGRFRNMVFAYMFESGKLIRFAQSPTGGGPASPAWDFQYIIPKPKTGKIYGFKFRAVYKPFISREDIQQEYNKWTER
ncbi:MAG: hypothetical protein SH818_05070 [Saprospiraceae bacterium]|nr:hypothetical protein [Saprospiraceae bacterium]